MSRAGQLENYRRRVAIEQAIARGLTATRIADTLNVPIDIVHEVWDDLDDLDERGDIFLSTGTETVGPAATAPRDPARVRRYSGRGLAPSTDGMVDMARREMAAIYGRTVLEHKTTRWPMPSEATEWERRRLARAVHGLRKGR